MKMNEILYLFSLLLLPTTLFFWKESIIFNINLTPAIAAGVLLAVPTTYIFLRGVVRDGW